MPHTAIVCSSLPIEMQKLCEKCAQQIQCFERGELQGDSTDCTEIVRLAVEQKDKSALDLLLNTVSTPLIKNKCYKDYPEFHDDIEDIVQDTLIRLEKAFKTKSDYRFAVFESYRKFVNVTIKRIVLNRIRQQKRRGTTTSIDDKDWEQNKPHPVGDSVFDIVSQKLTLRRIWTLVLGQIDNNRAREVFRRYYGLGELLPEIAISMQITEISAGQYLSQAKKSVKDKLPEVANQIRIILSEFTDAHEMLHNDGEVATDASSMISGETSQSYKALKLQQLNKSLMQYLDLYAEKTNVGKETNNGTENDK